MPILHPVITAALVLSTSFWMANASARPVQQAYLKASNTEANDQFGFAVAISGDTLVVGVPGESSIATGVNGDQSDNSALFAGAAYVFVRSGVTWIQQAYLKASNTQNNDQFGHSVAIAGDTVVVGARYEDSNATGVNGDASNNSIVDSGAVYVFIRNGATWSQQAYLKASNTGADDGFGRSVAIAGDTLVVGAYGEDGNATGVNGNEGNNSMPDSGAAYVFTRSGATWSQQAYLKASNTGGGDFFGYSVAMAGETLVVGAPYEDSSATGVNGDQNNNSTGDAGAVYVYTSSGATWSQQAYLKASNTGTGDLFGWSVGATGNTLVAGAPFEDSNATGVGGDQGDNSITNAGAAYAFTRSGSAWSQQSYLKASNPGLVDQFGHAVAIDGDKMVVGANREYSSATGIDGDQSDNSASGAGAAYLFARNGIPWSQQAYLKASNTGRNDRFAYALTISGDTLVVGARVEDGNSTGVNGEQDNNLANDAGAAYVFVPGARRRVMIISD